VVDVIVRIRINLSPDLRAYIDGIEVVTITGARIIVAHFAVHKVGYS